MYYSTGETSLFSLIVDLGGLLFNLNLKLKLLWKIKLFDKEIYKNNKNNSIL